MLDQMTECQDRAKTSNLWRTLPETGHSIQSLWIIRSSSGCRLVQVGARLQCKLPKTQMLAEGQASLERKVLSTWLVWKLGLDMTQRTAGDSRDSRASVDGASKTEETRAPPKIESQSTKPTQKTRPDKQGHKPTQTPCFTSLSQH